jgi:hypothetical protein
MHSCATVGHSTESRNIAAVLVRGKVERIPHHISLLKNVEKIFCVPMRVYQFARTRADVSGLSQYRCGLDQKKLLSFLP